MNTDIHSTLVEQSTRKPLTVDQPYEGKVKVEPGLLSGRIGLMEYEDRPGEFYKP